MRVMHAPGNRPLRRWRSPLARLVVVLVAGAFVGWEGVQGRFSTASHAGILATIGVVLVLALVAGRARQRKGGRTWARDAALALRAPFDAGRRRSARVAGGLVWVLLIAATVGWDAVSFTEQRHDLPTLSRLFGDVTDHDWGRALVFAAWVVLGTYLATGWRRPLGQPTGTDPAQPTGTARRDGRRRTPPRPEPPARDGVG